MEKLVFDRKQYGFGMAGLGPIVRGYSIVASPHHAQSLAEISATDLIGYLAYATEIRENLTAYYGNCLLTEHGNTPLCQVDDAKSIHCFHPHFLLFPNAPDIVPAAIDYFGSCKRFTNLTEAINATQDAEQYILISPNKTDYYLFLPTSGFPRQFIRMLVAEAIGKPHLASWRDHPNLDEAVTNSDQNRLILSKNA